MANPVLLVVDDDQAVLSAIQRDLRSKFGHEYRIVPANSGASAIDVSRQLLKRNEVVALFLTDQRMPQMTGLQFLEQARDVFPEAKRVLLTAYADTDVAISSINKLLLDYYLMKPWDPPEDNLFPILVDLLEDWQANVIQPYDGIRVAGTLWSPKSHEVKDFLARHQIGYQWLDVESDAKAKALVEEQSPGLPKLPMVFFPDGKVLIQPEIRELAEKAGIQTQASLPFYDVVIVGAGPAGLSASVYGASNGLRCLVIEKQVPGGQAGNSPKIENYLGFPAGISGMDLTRRAVTQAKRLGAEIISTQFVTKIRAQDNIRVITLSDGSEILTKAVLISTGAAFRTLDIPNIQNFTSAGVYYGAAFTEAAFYKDLPVFVVGGANSAGQGALFLSRFASKVTILIRRSIQDGTSKYLLDAEAANSKIERIFDSEIVEINGKPGKIEGIVINNRVTNEKTTLPGSAIFIFVGAVPQSDIVKDLVMLDEKGFILTGRDLIKDGKLPGNWSLDRDPFIQETSVPGIFAAGDVRFGTNHRVATATGEGGVTMFAIESYLKTL